MGYFSDQEIRSQERWVHNQMDPTDILMGNGKRFKPQRYQAPTFSKVVELDNMNYEKLLAVDKAASDDAHLEKYGI